MTKSGGLTMTETKTDPSPSTAETPENVWTFRGYRLKSGEFNTAMTHFYRGELSRANVWRRRLDSTTNWAVVTTAAVLTFTFGSAQNSHVVLLVSLLLICLFWIIESRRYRYYEVWALRVRLMETDFFAAMFNPPYAPHHEWATRLVDNLLTPQFPISNLEALGRRLRRNYFWLFLILGLAWVAKLMLHPDPATSIQSFFEHADIGLVSGHIVAFLVACFFFVIFLVAVLTFGLRASAGEVLSQREALGLPGELLHGLAEAASQVLPSEMPFIHRHEQLVIVITAEAENVSQQLLSLLKRGVTCLQGTGMYTGQPRSVLLCAVVPAEISRLKSAVYAVDANAFVVVNPTEEILGGGFSTLEPRWKQAAKKKK
jgi:uncharacterized membrane protein